MSFNAKRADSIMPPLDATANAAPPSSKCISVILVEDDPDFREAASLELEDLGFQVTSFEDGTSLLGSFARGHSGDVIVLDWGLPGMSGFDVIRKLRLVGISLPVIVLTGHASFSLEQLAFDHGARDFVEKSRGLQILGKRIRRVHSVHAGTIEEVLTFGSLTLKAGDCRVMWKGVDVCLTLTEYKTIHYLLMSDGPVTYRSVYDKMRNVGFIAGTGEEGYRINVRSCIKRVRNKFRSLDSAFDCIKNDVGVGYHWA